MMNAAKFSIFNHLDQHRQQFPPPRLKLATFHTELVNIGGNLRYISFFIKIVLPIRNMVEAIGRRAGRQAYQV